MERRERKRE
jgi:hypothetical protein